MNNLLDRQLSAIVLENFQTARVLESRGLDFCCGGKQTLRTACTEKGIGVETILDELNNIMRINDHAPDFQHLSLSTLTDYIVEVHHTYVRSSLPQIWSYLFKIATKHGDRFPHMKRVFVLFTQVKSELEAHMAKEEEVVFPLIKKLDHRDIPDLTFSNLTIDVLEEEHEMAGSLMQKIRELTNNYGNQTGGCTTLQLALNALAAFEADLHKHVHLENNILFPKAIERFEHIKVAGK